MPDKHRLFLDFENHLLNDENPSTYLREQEGSKLFKSVYPFTLLGNLSKIEQSPVHHPEGNVWKHTLLVVDRAALVRPLSSEPQILMWSALLHDLGKTTTTKLRKGRITAYDHDRQGALLAAQFLGEFSNDEVFIDKVSCMVRWHMQILFVVKNLPFADIDRMMAEVPLGEIALLSLCDRLGRGNMSKAELEDEIENLKCFLTKCQNHKDKSIEMKAPYKQSH